jgi:CRP/FNR family transcriptional regulator, cyclic AMP receptor protein
MMITTAELRALPLFASLDDPTLLDLGKRMLRCKFRAGQHISLEGEQPLGVFFVLSGRVRLSRTAPDGREQVLSTVGPGENFDLVPVLDGEPCPSTARAMSQVECLLLPREELQSLIYRHPGLAIAAMQTMAHQLRSLVDLVEDLAFRSVRARLARQLLAVAGGGSAGTGRTHRYDPRNGRANTTAYGRRGVGAVGAGARGGARRCWFASSRRNVAGHRSKRQP